MSDLNALLPLLIAAIGITVILFGWAGVGKLLRLLFAPIGCLLKGVATVAVLAAVAFFLFAGRLDLPGDLFPGGGLPPIPSPPSLPPSGVPASPTGLFRMPFDDRDVTMSEGPRYSDGSEHFGAGLAFDYVKGDVNGSSDEWQSFAVVAAADGVAIRSCEGADALTVPPYTDSQCARGFGHFVLVRHDATDSAGRHYYTLYAHLDPDSISPALPQRWRRETDFTHWKRVNAGEYLGMSGQTGLIVCRSDCIHLHFEVYRGGYYRNPVDPYDISTPEDIKTRDAYPEFSSLAHCGSEALWIECPSRPGP
jgi:murein DD-endopeptidase MepM/ murein hydrolase activator NlpD